MINYFTEDGQRIPPHAAAKTPVGQTIARQAEFYGVKYFVPFSSMHKYQRADSVWAAEYTTTLRGLRRAASSPQTCELLPAFIRYDCAKDSAGAHPPEGARHRARWTRRSSATTGASGWSPRRPRRCERYFQRVRAPGRGARLPALPAWAARSTSSTFHARTFHKGITFEVPRNSLMTAVRYEIFDDLLIGNFMKTTLHGDFGERGLYPDFSPYVAKYADNGRARTRNELKPTSPSTARRDPLGFLRRRLEAHCVRPLQTQSAELLRTVLPADSAAFRAAKETFWKVAPRPLVARDATSGAVRRYCIHPAACV